MNSNAAQEGARDDIESLGPWFHNIHLPDGRQTAPQHPYGDFPSFKWDQVRHAVPQDLHGWTALDIGCNAGFYALEMARRGAHVTAVDIEPMYLDQARWVVHQFGMRDRIDIAEAHVYELLGTRDTFDFVWFTGVFYHLKYPALALDVVRRATRRLMMFQTMTMPGEHVIDTPFDLPLEERAAMRDPGWPAMAFIEHKVANDATNWWAPNHACVEAMLRAAGFKVLKRPAHEFYLCRPVEPVELYDLDRLSSVIAGS